MTPRRLKAFTLIELLVVIAIIAILAAMLFPVFARARESARKIQCLSNVKNLAMAVQIYLSDYDAFPPKEHRPEVIAWMEATGHSLDYNMNNANPYLRWDVVFDEYVKNRDIYRCPSAKVASTVEHIVPVPDWFAWVVSTGGNCDAQANYPLGWGGTQTDGGCTNWAGPNTGAAELDIAFSEELLREKKPSSFDDPAKTLVVAERSLSDRGWWWIEQIAYPELCRINWSPATKQCGCGSACETEWGVCTFSDTDIVKFWTDASMRKPWARHMGGNNLGFADGHAAWWPADAMVVAVNKTPQDLQGGLLPQCAP
jgi:prepilin-type N-terminal cleavage/methylation domain-containing protein/prepilin-type processing-associated H-X9-DG protein